MPPPTEPSGTLILQSFAGLLFLLVIMGAALFIPYGGFGYRLAWIYLGVFSLSVIVITVYLFLFDKHLLKSRLAAGPVAEQRSIQKVIQSVAGLAFIGIFVLSSFDFKNRWSTIPQEISYAADLFCILAFALLFFVFRQNTYLSATIEVQEKQQVISTGFYGIVRHPMYSSASILLLFTPIALGSWFGLIPVLVIIGVIIYRAIDEENELKRNLHGYIEYCEKVKYRLIPYIF